MNLSILTVTRGEPHSPRFLRHFRAVADMLSAEFVVAYDRVSQPACDADHYIAVESSGVIEDVLVQAHAACSGEYVLRMDDDESLCPTAILALYGWCGLDSDSKSYAIRRANLWGDQWHAVSSGSLFPDLQARLMPRDRETRTTVHEGMPFDIVFPGMILHHKFLIKSYAERAKIAERYEQKRAGCGSGHYLQFSVPEDCGPIETFSIRSPM